MYQKILSKIKPTEDLSFKLFLLVGILTGVASGINSTVFNNFLSDTYHLSATARGIVEFPRELPGTLIVLVLGVITFLGDIRMAAVGMLAAALGMAGIGLLSPTFSVMLMWMMVFSLGTHIYLPLAPAIGMDLSNTKEYGMRLGQYNSYNLAATIAGYAIVWVGFKYLKLNYNIAFVIAAAFYAFSAFTLGAMHSKKSDVHKRPKFIFRKKYLLYYVLSIVNGARKQIFLTFAPWVLIQMFHVDPPTFAILGLLISFVSIATRTLVGKAIDIKGERFVLSWEAVLLILLCMGYAFSEQLFSTSVAVIIVCACYVLDLSLNAVEMARSTYVKKIAVHPHDVTPTLSAGTSFDHVVSMSIPFLGGLVWTSFGYKYVFILAIGIALANLILSMKIKT